MRKSTFILILVALFLSVSANAFTLSANTKLVTSIANRFASVTDTAMADAVFSWGERSYPEYFSPATNISQNYSGYYYRHYDATDSYLAVKDGILYAILQGSNNLITVGPLSEWATKAGYTPATTPVTTPVTPQMSVGQAVAIDYIASVIHWQIDHNMYTLDDFLGMGGGTHFQYQDLFTIDINQNVSPDTHGYVTMTLYRGHNWKLTSQELSDMSDALNNDTYINQAIIYQNNQDLTGYMNLTQSMASQYDALVVSEPDYSQYQF